MLTVHGYVLTAIAFHVCLVIGLLTYAISDSEPNHLAGVRTPRTLKRPEDWRRANTQAAAIFPTLSSICALVSLGGIWIDVLRTGLAVLLIIGVQVIAMICFAAAWWTPPPEE